jgi:hypothetical protein
MGAISKYLPVVIVTGGLVYALRNVVRLQTAKGGNSTGY